MIFRLLSRNNATCCSVAIVGDGVRIGGPFSIESRSRIDGIGVSSCIVSTSTIWFGIPSSESVPGVDQASRVRRDSQVNPMGFCLSCWDRPAGRSIGIVGYYIAVGHPFCKQCHIGIYFVPIEYPCIDAFSFFIPSIERVAIFMRRGGFSEFQSLRHINSVYRTASLTIECYSQNLHLISTWNDQWYSKDCHYQQENR